MTLARLGDSRLVTAYDHGVRQYIRVGIMDIMVLHE